MPGQAGRELGGHQHHAGPHPGRRPPPRRPRSAGSGAPVAAATPAWPTWRRAGARGVRFGRRPCAHRACTARPRATEMCSPADLQVTATPTGFQQVVTLRGRPNVTWPFASPTCRGGYSRTPSTMRPVRHAGSAIFVAIALGGRPVHKRRRTALGWTYTTPIASPADPARKPATIFVLLWAAPAWGATTRRRSSGEC